MPADPGSRRHDRHLAHRHLGLAAVTQCTERAGVRAFHGRTQRVVHDPPAFGAGPFSVRTPQPALRDRHQQFRMILADVVEVVGHRTAHEFRRIAVKPV